MDGSFTDDQVHEWLQEVADGAWISLHYDTPGLAGVGNCEISGGGYVRAQVSFTDPANRSIWSLSDARFTGLVQTQITHFGVNSAATAGRLRAYARLPEKVTILNGFGYILYQGDLAISFG
jgi:hypothetical protein